LEIQHPQIFYPVDNGYPSSGTAWHFAATGTTRMELVFGAGFHGGIRRRAVPREQDKGVFNQVSGNPTGFIIDF